MRYIAIFDGAGGPSAGCDYTIGCNEFSRVFDASGEDTAMAQCRQIWEYYGKGERIEDIKLFELGEEIPVPVDEWNDADTQQREKEEAEDELRVAEDAVRRAKEKLRK